MKQIKEAQNDSFDMLPCCGASPITPLSSQAAILALQQPLLSLITHIQKEFEMHELNENEVVQPLFKMPKNYKICSITSHLISFHTLCGEPLCKANQDWHLFPSNAPPLDWHISCNHTYKCPLAYNYGRRTCPTKLARQSHLSFGGIIQLQSLTLVWSKLLLKE
jgi:hypothetical protein